MLINDIVRPLIFTALLAFTITIASYHFRLVNAIDAENAALAKVEMLSANINVQNDAIGKLAAQAQQDNAKLLHAEKDANAAQFAYQRNEAQIMSTNVSGGCNNAIQWGIDQAIKMREPDVA